jgi:transposase
VRQGNETLVFFRKMLSQEQRETIIRMRESKCDWNAIALALKKTPVSCRVWFCRYRKTLDMPPRVITPKRKVTGRLGLITKKVVTKKPDLSQRNLAAAVRAEVGPNVDVPSYRTLGRYLAVNGFKIMHAVKKPLISDINKQRRVNWAKDMSDMDPDFWDHVIWSDETTVRKLPKDKDMHFWVHSSTKKDDRPLNYQVQGGGFSVMFWGAFSRSALGPLVAIEGTMNAESYIDILKEYVIPELAAAGKPMIFQQDNAPCHKAKVVKDFLAANNVRTLEWPAQSPDMNPIENLWAIVKRKRQAKFGVPRTRKDLIEQIFTIWKTMEVEILQKLSDSMENRLQAVLFSKGKPTKY